MLLHVSNESTYWTYSKAKFTLCHQKILGKSASLQIQTDIYVSYNLRPFTATVRIVEVCKFFVRLYTFKRN